MVVLENQHKTIIQGQVIYSEEYEKDDDEYLGENKVLFCAGDDCYDIIDYDELYLYFACEFYIKKHENEIVQEQLLSIKEKYCVKLLV